MGHDRAVGVAQPHDHDGDFEYRHIVVLQRALDICSHLLTRECRCHKFFDGSGACDYDRSDPTQHDARVPALLFFDSLTSTADDAFRGNTL